MRVYGASPLYNYVELIFRSKRLFIVSVVLATAIVSLLATTRAKNYTATMVVGLSGTQTTSGAQVEAGQLGSIRFKLNVLNLYLRSPNLIKDAMRKANLDKDVRGVQLSEIAFDKFCKDVKLAITYGQPTENALDISCRWPDDRAALIINAFYAAYSDYVLGKETVMSTQKTSTLASLLTSYDEQVKTLQSKLNQYQTNNVDRPLTDLQSAQNAYSNSKKSIEDLNFQLRFLDKRLGDLRSKLAVCPEFIDGSTITGSAKDTSGYDFAKAEVAKAQSEFSDIDNKYSPANPLWKAAKEKLDGAKKKMKEEETPASSKSQGPVISKSHVRNPQFDLLSAAVSTEETNISVLKEQLNLTLQRSAASKRDAKSFPVIADNYQWMVDELTSVKSVHSMLRQNLQIAKFNEAEDRQLHTNEMYVIVQPESEQENAGAKSLLLYAAGPLLGLVIASAFSLVFETLDHSLRTPIEVEKHLKKPVLAVLPRMDVPKKTRRQLGTGSDSKSRPSLPSA